MSLAAVIILGPLAGVAGIVLLRRWSVVTALLGVVASLVAAGLAWRRVEEGARFVTTLPGLPAFPLRLEVDPLSAVLATTVAAVAALVVLYAVGYMHGERDQRRFFAGMSLFVAAMQTVILAGDWILFLAAWELIGFASYLLIGFWYERPGVGGAATRAFVTTRAADVGLYVGVFALVTATGTTEIAATLDVDRTTGTVAGLGFLLAAAGKSAQVPFQGWLQDAMAGPTPVSALLHSATLVVAGVILLARALPALPDEVRLLVGIVGGATAVVTGVMAVAERDLKRMLAASTSSQLGFMLLGLGAGSVVAAIIHLVAHAAMKSALFLGAGIFQHAREATGFAELAGIGRERRRVFGGFVVAGLALAGVPPLAGFWSKDAILAATLTADAAWLLLPLAVVGTLLTGVYVGRAMRLLWRQPERSAEGDGRSVAGAGWMGAGLAGLALLAATLGLSVRPIADLLEREAPENMTALIIGLVAALLGLGAGWAIPSRRLIGPLSVSAARGFRLGDGFGGFISGPVMALARASDRLDGRLHAGVLATGQRLLAVARTINGVDAALSRLATGVGSSALVVAQMSTTADTDVHRVVTGTGTAAMRLAIISQSVVEATIDGLIAAVVRSTRRLGGLARRLQTGLVHRELLVAAGGAAVVLVLVFLL